jgi:hypothetical protein
MFDFLHLVGEALSMIEYGQVKTEIFDSMMINHLRFRLCVLDIRLHRNR